MITKFLQWFNDGIYRWKLRRAIHKNHGRALCSHCLQLLVWHNYQEREIQITPSQAIMLFCPDCDARAKHEQTNDGEWIVRAFRRWYDYMSGFKQDNRGNGHFEACLERVLEYYGWIPKEKEENNGGE